MYDNRIWSRVWLGPYSKEHKKCISSEQNREITKSTQKVGLLSAVQLVIGSPSETNEMIKEKIRFLKDVNDYQFSLNYLIPLPETPSWQYVMKRKLITDVEIVSTPLSKDFHCKQQQKVS